MYKELILKEKKIAECKIFPRFDVETLHCNVLLLAYFLRFY